jgi:DNA-binding MarR family transcriptional regulator
MQPNDQSPEEGLTKVALAKWFYAIFELRPGMHIEGLHTDPAWNMLLDLYIHESAGVRTSVTAACISARVPSTTALRHIATLHDHRFISRQPDENDRRRHWLALTDDTSAAIDDYLGRALALLKDLLARSSSEFDMIALMAGLRTAAQAIRDAGAALQPLEHWARRENGREALERPHQVHG